MPCHVAILVVRVAVAGNFVFWYSKLAFQISLSPCCSDLIIVNDLFATDNNPRPKFSKDGARCDHAYGSSLVGMGNNISPDEITLRVLWKDDFV